METIIRDKINEYSEKRDNSKYMSPSWFWCNKRIEVYEKELNALDAREHIELSDMLTAEQRDIVLSVIRDRQSISMIAGGGVGKSFVIREIIRLLTSIYGDDDLICIAAPTGIAAVQIGGITAHRAFGLSVNNRPVKKLRPLYCYNYLIIDEISMVSDVMLETIVSSLGSLINEYQIICVGDFRQLSPVQGRYAFHSEAWNKLNLKKTKLTKVIRQTDDTFATILNKIRLGIYDDECKQYLSRCSVNQPDQDSTIIFGTNIQVDQMNKKRLDALDSPLYTYEAIDYCEKVTKGEERVKCATPKKHMFWENCASKKTIDLKVNALVLFNRNIKIDDDISVCNGTSGIVKQLDPDSVKIELSSGDIVNIGRQCYDYTDKQYDSNGKLEKTLILTRSQIPLRLAFSLTVNRVQGCTLDKVSVDGSMRFNSQIYTGLSRARSIEGLTIFNFDKLNISANKEVDAYEATCE